MPKFGYGMDLCNPFLDHLVQIIQTRVTQIHFTAKFWRFVDPSHKERLLRPTCHCAVAILWESACVGEWEHIRLFCRCIALWNICTTRLTFAQKSQISAQRSHIYLRRRAMNSASRTHIERNMNGSCHI